MLSRVARGLTPPVIAAAFARLRRRAAGAYDPAWHEILGGELRGRRLLIDPRDGLWQQRMLQGAYDDFLFEYLRGVELAGRTVFDVGAHIGLHSLYFAQRVGRAGAVHAFEPNPCNRERLQAVLLGNPDLAPRVRVHPEALGARGGRTRFYISRDVDGGGSSGSFAGTAHTYYPRSQVYQALFEEIEVPTATLDDLDAVVGAGVVPDLLKIDVEGAEGGVLQGGSRALREHRPRILVEVHSIHAMFETAQELSAADYEMVLLREERDGRCFVAAEPR
jgi:FkbM family methyltransferase